MITLSPSMISNLHSTGRLLHHPLMITGIILAVLFLYNVESRLPEGVDVIRFRHWLKTEMVRPPQAGRQEISIVIDDPKEIFSQTLTLKELSPRKMMRLLFAIESASRYAWSFDPPRKNAVHVLIQAKDTEFRFFFPRLSIRKSAQLQNFFALANIYGEQGNPDSYD